METIIYNSLAFLILAFAVFITVKKVYQTLFKKQETSCASGCSGCASKCDLKQLVNNNSSTTN